MSAASLQPTTVLGACPGREGTFQKQQAHPSQTTQKRCSQTQIHSCRSRPVPGNPGSRCGHRQGPSQAAEGRGRGPPPQPRAWLLLGTPAFPGDTVTLAFRGTEESRQHPHALPGCSLDLRLCHWSDPQENPSALLQPLLGELRRQCSLPGKAARLCDHSEDSSSPCAHPGALQGNSGGPRC